MRRSIATGAWACALLAGAAACSSDGQATTAEPSSTGTASCGTYELVGGTAVPDEAWACLRHGEATGAELVVSRPTTEGDPIVTRYRVGPDVVGVEVVVDTTADRFGPQQVSRADCAGFDAAHELLGCDDA